MSNNKDFKVKNGIQPTSYFEGLGTVVSGSEGYNLAVASYDSVSFNITSQDGQPFGITFKPDGTKMYLVGNTGDRVYQYTLSTAWDLSTSSYDSVSFSVSSQDGNPTRVTFNNDGTKMYLVGQLTDSLYQYSLSTGFDISTASYDSVSLSVNAQDGIVYDVAFNTDGTKMYVMGDSTDSAYQYTLSTAFDISTASYDSVSFSFASQRTSVNGFDFSVDGTKLYVSSHATPGAIFQYTLSTAFDLSTTSYDGISFEVASQDSAAFSVKLSSDGAKMYFLGRTNDTVYQYSTVLTTNTLDLSTGSVFEITPTSDIQVSLTNPAASGTSSGATLLLDGEGVSTYFEGASYADKLKTVATEDTNPFGLFFKPDGTKMYMAGGSGDSIYEYDLSTAWDVSTASYVQNFSLVAQGTSPEGVSFSSDGTEMYVLLSSTDGIYQYSLSTAWDISTASYASKSLIVTSQETSPNGIAFKPDGTKLYMCGGTSDRVHQYTLSTAWDLSTATYDSKSLLVTGQFTNPSGVSFSFDGSVLVSLGDTSNVAYQYSLSTPWDVSTATYNGVSFDFSNIGNSAKDIFLGSNNSFYIPTTLNVVAGGANDSIYQFSSGESSYTITYDTSLQWSGGTAPTSPAIGETDVLTFNTTDGGTTYNAALAIDGAS